MSKPVSNAIVLVLSLIGCLVTLVLLYEHFAPAADIGCSTVGGDCKAANESEYGHIGPIPTSAFGLGMYLTLAGLCLKRRKLLLETGRVQAEADASYTISKSDGDPLDPEVAPHAADTQYKDRIAALSRRIRTADIAVWAIAAPAVVISIWLQKVALFQLIDFCPWCMTSCFLVTLIFLAASKDMFLPTGKLEGEQKLLAGAVTFIAIMCIFMEAPEVLYQIHLCQLKSLTVKGPVTQTQLAKLPPIATKEMETTGPANAPYLIVEFADYQCPHCMKASIQLAETMRSNPNMYRLGFRNYPITNVHKWGQRAALAAEAAGEQGRFWQMHDFIFQHQGEMEKPDFTVDRFAAFASQVGLDPDIFQKDMQSDKIITRVATDAATGNAWRISMTPSFFIQKRGNSSWYRVTGLDDFERALKDPNDKAWQ